MGIVFYEMSTLIHPLTVSNGDLISWQEAHFFQNPTLPDKVNKSLSPMISQTIAKMIEKNPAFRFKDWSQVRTFLANDNTPLISDSALIEKVLKKRIEVDNTTKERQLATEKRKKEIKDIYDLISYQFNNDILDPIRIFLDEINSRYVGTKNDLTISSDSIKIGIHTSSHKHISIEVKPIIKEDFYRDIVFEDHAVQHRSRELHLPTYGGKPLLAWGYLKAEDKRGFNLLLVENEDSPYGTWYRMINRSGAFARVQRIEPFPFEFDEIEKEIQRIVVLDNYIRDVRALDVSFIREFIAEYI